VASSSGGADEGEPTAGESGETGDSPKVPLVPGPTLRRLTEAEFRHSVQDLLGPVSLSTVEADAAQDGFFAVGAARVALSPAGVAQYEAALGEAVTQAFADPVALAQRLVCVPALLTDTACFRDAIAKFGRRAWRRPLTGDELDRYTWRSRRRSGRRAGARARRCGTRCGGSCSRRTSCIASSSGRRRPRMAGG
jgi:hypothetical protein